MDAHNLIYTFFLIFSFAAVLGTFVLFTRQPIIVAGALLGPHAFKMVNDTNLLHDISHAGIILLLLLGLEMHPSHLRHMLKRVARFSCF